MVESAQARTSLLDDMRAAWQADLAGDGFSPDQIARRVRRGDVLRRAPLLIVPCLVADAAHEYPDGKRNASERAMFLVSMGAAVENLLVALAVDGIGSCWVSSALFCREAAAGALGLAADWEPMGTIGVGYPAAPAPARPGREPGQFTLWRYASGGLSAVGADSVREPLRRGTTGTAGELRAARARRRRRRRWPPRPPTRSAVGLSVGGRALPQRAAGRARPAPPAG